MIQIDIDMPKCCGNCLVGFCKQIGCDKHIGFDNYDTERHPDCPLKEVSDNSVLEDIKDELLNKSFTITNPKNTYEYINVVSLADIESVIDKYMN